MLLFPSHRTTGASDTLVVEESPEERITHTDPTTQFWSPLAAM